jgi:hypothetical protein
MNACSRCVLLLVPFFAACGAAPSAPSGGPAAADTAMRSAAARPDDASEPSVDEHPLGLEGVAEKLAAPGAFARIEAFAVAPSCFSEVMLDPKVIGHMAEETEITNNMVSIKDPAPRAFARLRRLVAAMPFEKPPRVAYTQLSAEGKYIGWAGVCLVEPPVIAAGDLAPIKPGASALAVAKPAVARLRALGPDIESVALVFEGTALVLAHPQALAKSKALVLTLKPPK